jgi:hypothetical protein
LLNKKRDSYTSSEVLSLANSVFPRGTTIDRVASHYASILQGADPRKVNTDMVRLRFQQAILSQFKTLSNKDSNIKYLDSTINILKQTNALTPEIIEQINATAAARQAAHLNDVGYLQNERAKQDQLNTNKRTWELKKYPYKYVLTCDDMGNDWVQFFKDKEIKVYDKLEEKSNLNNTSIQAEIKKKLND